MKTVEQRFWEKVHISATTGCWLWQSTLLKGYGTFWSGSSTVRAHRWAYQKYVGSIDGLVFRHSKDCPKHCVNPFPGHARRPSSQAENNRDQILDRSHFFLKKTHCANGHEFDGVNNLGHRICSICRRNNLRRWRQNNV